MDRQIELAKSILEAHGYKVTKKLKESDNKNHFQVGDEMEYTGVMSGLHVSQKVLKVNADTILVEESWISEDTGETVKDTETYEIDQDEQGNECIVVWEYSGHLGRVYPPKREDSSRKITESSYTLKPYDDEVVYSGAEVLGGLDEPEVEALAGAVKSAAEMLGTDLHDLRCINHNEAENVDFTEISKLDAQDQKEIKKNDYHVVLSLVKDASGLMIVFEENLYAPDGYGEPDYNIYFSHEQYQEIHEDILSKVKKALEDAGIDYNLRGKSGDFLVVRRGDLRRASEIRDEIDPENTVKIGSNA